MEGHALSFWDHRTVFVTGCTGFLGRWLTRELNQRGARVIGLVRGDGQRPPIFPDDEPPRLTPVKGSVEDYAVLERALVDHEIDTVVHLAAQAIVTDAMKDPRAALETNVRGTWNLLEACRKTGSVSRILVASSDKAYGAHDKLPYREEHPLRGTFPYDVSKSCADLISTMYHRTYGTPVCATRCGNVFGPGDLNTSRIVPGTIQSALRGERPVIRSDGSPVRDYLYVQDAIHGYRILAEKMDNPEVCGQAFNFGTGEPLSVLELTRRILKLAGLEGLEPDIRGGAKAEVEEQYVSYDRAHDLLGWEPGRSVTERLGETVQWHRDYLSRATV